MKTYRYKGYDIVNNQCGDEFPFVVYKKKVVLGEFKSIEGAKYFINSLTTKL